MVDLTDRGAHGDLVQRYGVRGIPAIFFCAPDGSVIESMQERDAAGLAEQIRRITGG